ncbi:MAG: hypothetical protein JWM57_528 [Phycisphaerales bacterium]|nr:hypothetical protein [Phycisphaerales bacterium]
MNILASTSVRTYLPHRHDELWEVRKIEIKRTGKWPIVVQMKSMPNSNDLDLYFSFDPQTKKLVAKPKQIKPPADSISGWAWVDRAAKDAHAQFSKRVVEVK